MTTSERLVDKAKEAFVMAIEIYNKPTINYRLEGFSFFICICVGGPHAGIIDVRHGNRFLPLCQ